MYRQILVENRQEILQYVVTDCLKPLILDSIHSKVQQGEKRMRQLLHTRGYWVKIAKLVEEYCGDALGSIARLRMVSRWETVKAFVKRKKGKRIFFRDKNYAKRAS